MDMIRQQHPSTNREWTLLPYLVNYGTQNLPALLNRQDFSPFVGDNSEEIGYTRYPHPPIVRHVCIFPSMQFLCRAGIACQIKPTNMMQCKHGHTITIIRPMSKSFHPFHSFHIRTNYPYKSEISGRRCLPYP